MANTTPKANAGNTFGAAQASAASSDTGKQQGSPAQDCPLANLSVTVVSNDPKSKPVDSIRIEISGPEGGVKFAKAGVAAKFLKIKAGDYSVSARIKGWRLVEKKTQTLACGETAQVQLVVARCELVKLTPDSGPKPTKWYVNQDTDEAQKHGRDITIQAHIDREEADVTVYFSVDADANNRASLLDALKEKLAATSAKTNAKGIAEVSFTLSRYGGDKFRVSASLEENRAPGSAGTKQTQWFEVWRKVFYEVDCMKRPSGGGTYADLADAAAMVSEYKKHFVELVATGADSQPTHRRILTEAEVATWCTPTRSGSGAPRYFHVAVIDSIVWDPVNQERKYSLTNLQVTNSLPAATNTMDTRDWLQGNVRVIVKRVDSTGTEAWGSWQTLPNPENHIKLAAVGDNFELEIDLRNVLGLGAGPGLPAGIVQVWVKFTLKIWVEGSGLQASNGSTIVGMRWRERKYNGAELKNRTINTMVHESGHALGLASTTLPDGNALATTYVKNGHHCHEKANKCVMWEANLPDTEFCDSCSDALKGRNLSSLPVSGNSAM